MTRIVFIGGNLSKNKGGAAIVISARNALKNIINDAEFILLSFADISDFKMGKIYNICVVPELTQNNSPLKSTTLSIFHMILCYLRLFRAALWRIIYGIFGLNVRNLVDEKVLEEYTKSDIVIEVSGDGLSGDYGIFSILVSFSRIMTCILLEKPIAIYAQSIGPYNIKWPILSRESKILSKFCRFFARCVLNKVDLITVREDITLDILRKLGVTKPPIYLTADSAFLLPPAIDERIQEILSEYGVQSTDKTIGLSVSRNISKLQYDSESTKSYDHYKSLLLQIIDYIMEKFDVKIILIPHVTGPRDLGDDRVIIREILQDIKNRKSVIGITEDLTPEELKGIIGRSELFIGSRMHANIAALSMEVPTLAIGYSHKTRGIARMAGQEEFVCDINTMTWAEIRDKIDTAWNNRQEISKEIKNNMIHIKEKAYYNGILIKELLDSKPHDPNH